MDPTPGGDPHELRDRVTEIDYERVAGLRADGLTWAEVADALDYPNHESLRKLYHKWRNRQPYPGMSDEALSGGQKDEREESTIISGRQFRGVRNLDDLVDFFDVDLDLWEVKTLKVGGSEWDQSVEKGTVAQSVRLDATFVRRLDHKVEAALAALALCREDMGQHAPPYDPPARPSDLGQGAQDVLQVLALFDAHLGMRAWGAEVGEDYDLDIAESDYVRTATHLLSLGRLYNVGRVLYVVGNDLGHVNQYAEKTLTTRKGTPQDVDSRLAKIFTTLRKATVAVADQARLIAPVDIMVVEGNHDPDEMYKLGEVLHAWYRNDPEVTVLYSPRKRKWYGHGRNTFMLTHGEEYERKKRNLPLIMGSEMPPELYAASAGPGGHREILSGHLHARKQGTYVPTSDVSEDRAIITRSLPGLTAMDKWHSDEGYLHRRAGTALFYYHEGGLAGLHEFNPSRQEV